MQILNPYDQSVIADVPDFNEQQVRDATGRAAAAGAVMAEMPAYKRAAILERVSRMIESQNDDLARLMAKESGKPLKAARVEAARAVDTFRFAADEARHLHGETIPMDAVQSGVGKIGYYMRVPVGVVAAITPFNFPLNLVAHKVAPAVAAGCTMVLKPAPATPLTALRLADLLREAGLPEGALEIVTGGADVGYWLTSDPRVAMITFTGSHGVAREISKVTGLRRTVFELGGNAATIIAEDGNVSHAVGRVVDGGFGYSGQSCISVQRVYVHKSRYDEFRDQFIPAVNKLRLGDPLDDQTDIGPVINEAAAERIEAWLTEAVEQGAFLATGGLRDGQMISPTVLENVEETMKVMRQEVFGPVVSLAAYDDFEAALGAADNSVFGLQAGLYTRDLNKVTRAIQRLNVGGLVVNDVPTFRADHMPYGGNKDSGVGREGPRFTVEEMTNLKMVVINLGV